MSEFQAKFGPKDTEEKLIKRLKLHDGAWAIKVKKALYVFPPETTREEAEKALRKAWMLYQTSMN